MDTIRILAEKLSNIAAVEAIMLSGSQTNGTADAGSDYDLYVYASASIPVEERKKILDVFFSSCEYDNQFWETEDIGILRDGGTKVELMYRGFDFVENEYARLFLRHEAHVGYSTCIWHNLACSVILFDRDGRGTAALEKFKNAAYPQQLKENIIAKNFPILRDASSGYYTQIKAAIQRNDIVSINHRTAAFLESYFDIIFALNELPHPGEKKLLRFVSEKCRIVPVGWKKNITTLLKCAAGPDERLLSILDTLAENLRDVCVDAE